MLIKRVEYCRLKILCIFWHLNSFIILLVPKSFSLETRRINRRVDLTNLQNTLNSSDKSLDVELSENLFNLRYIFVTAGHKERYTISFSQTTLKGSYS